MGRPGVGNQVAPDVQIGHPQVGAKCERRRGEENGNPNANEGSPAARTATQHIQVDARATPAPCKSTVRGVFAFRTTRWMPSRRGAPNPSHEASAKPCEGSGKGVASATRRPAVGTQRFCSTSPHGRMGDPLPSVNWPVLPLGPLWARGLQCCLRPSSPHAPLTPMPLLSTPLPHGPSFPMLLALRPSLDGRNV